MQCNKVILVTKFNYYNQIKSVHLEILKAIISLCPLIPGNCNCGPQLLNPVDIKFLQQKTPDRFTEAGTSKLTVLSTQLLQVLQNQKHLIMPSAVIAVSEDVKFQGESSL